MLEVLWFNIVFSSRIRGLKLFNYFYFMKGFVYILSNKNRTVLYIGATKDLRKRVQKHIAGKSSEFTKRYNVTELMYFEILDSYHEAFLREKQLKNWRKSWKWNLIKAENPKLENLYLNLRTS